jgi:hypothetical protein
MRVTRKEFLSTLAAGLAGAVLRPARLLAASPSDTISLETFQRYVGTSFRVIRPAGANPVNVILQEVIHGKDSKETVQFSLSFVAPGGETLAEGSFRFEHADMGAIPIFVTKVRTDPQGQTWYRADYNLLQSKAGVQNNRNTRTVPGRPPSSP